MDMFNQFENDYCLLKHGADSEQSKCPCFPFQGVRLPVYLLGSLSSLEGGACGLNFCTLEKQSLLDSLLLAQWEERAWKGLFNYDVTQCVVKVTDGKRKFFCQLNEEWVPNFFPVLKAKGFDHRLDSPKCNCMVAQTEGLLFSVKSGEKPVPELIQSATAPSGANLSIMINENPIEYGHVFLLPSDLCGFSGLLDARLLEMVTRVAVETSNCSFRLYYDFLASSSECLCFQGCYFSNPLPVERMSFINLSGNWQGKGIQISEVTDYPIKTLLFKSEGNMKLLVELVAVICSCLQDQNVQYSLLITDLGTKMFLFFQLDMLENAESLSALECGGYFVFKKKHDFDQITEGDLLKHLAAKSLSDVGFLAVKQLCGDVADKL